MWANCSILNLFFPMIRFNPPKNIKKPNVFWCFQGDQKESLGRKELTELEHHQRIWLK